MRMTFMISILAAIAGAGIALAVGTATEGGTPVKTMPADARFTCPMEEHPDETDAAKQGPYFSAEPGKCPWCGMKLKPLESVKWTAEYRRGSPANADQPVKAQPATMPSPSFGSQTRPATIASTPADMAFACPMKSHPDEKDPAARGPYFAGQSGECPRCGMTLKPVEELTWTKAWLAAQGAQVAFTCPDHPHVFAREGGACPRCGRSLESFKVMYTCPDPKHAGVISLAPGRCPHDRQPLTAFRGIWLGDKMAAANLPPSTQPAAEAAYRCSVHPLVHSNAPGACTICAGPLQAVHPPASRPQAASAPARAEAMAQGGYLCPMHPDKVRSDKPGTCSICAMQLVSAARFQPVTTATDRVQRELDHITEHYLAVQKLLASDSTTDLARHALGITAASEEMLKHVGDLEPAQAKRIQAAARMVHDAALKLSGTRISENRVELAGLSSGMVALLNDLRPDRQRWPHLYVFHCPMSKGDWVQADKEKTNPYYGFQMLKCGELKATK